MKTFEEFREGISRPSFPKWMLGVTDGDYGLDDTIHTTAKHYLISTSDGVLGRKATAADEKKNLTSYLNDLYKRFKGINSEPRKKDVEKALKDSIMYMQQLRQKNESINEAVITKKNGVILISGNDTDGEHYWIRVEPFSDSQGTIVNYGWHIAYDKKMPNLNAPWDDGDYGQFKELIRFIKDNKITDIDIKKLESEIKKLFG